jgi:NAD(P)-dependent dehydrogenase (short-subunit alcohol dehydrogenase family)
MPHSDEPDSSLWRVTHRSRDSPERGRAGARAVRADRQLINNAGIFIGKPFTDYTLEDYAAITAVNLVWFFHITQLASGRVTQGSGHVVNISTSLVDHADSIRPSALAALTKGGLAAVARSLAIEYASRGVPCFSSNRASTGAENSSGTHGIRQASHIPPRAGVM